MANINMERVRQSTNAGLPFTPFGGGEVSGSSMNRVLDAMATFNWADLRFISRKDADRLGWKISANANGVWVRYPGEQVEIFNGQDVEGMPSIETLLGLSDEELSLLQDDGPDLVDTVSVVPARRQIEQSAKVADLPVPAVGPLDAGESGRFVVTAPYWLDGLHNHAGIALAKDLNDLIRKTGLSRDPKAIQRLLEGRGRSAMYELKIVSEEEHLRDKDFLMNLAEPKSLLGGALVRDDVGGYRPKEGGASLLMDEGESLIIQSKSAQAYEAAIELAKSKGWTAIELSGKGKMLADAWLEAKIAGIDVVNFSPSIEDEQRLAERFALEARKQELAAEKAAPAADQERLPDQQTAEVVEVHPYLENGQLKTATVSYTITQDGVRSTQVFGDAKDAAQAFVSAPLKSKPAVVRSTVRADGQTVATDVMVASIQPSKEGARSKMIRVADPMVDREFHAALSVLEQGKSAPEKETKTKGVAQTEYTGKILRVEGDCVVQKIGRRPTDVKMHPIDKLSRIPSIGETVDILADAKGALLVSDVAKVQSLER